MLKRLISNAFLLKYYNCKYNYKHNGIVFLNCYEILSKPQYGTSTCGIKIPSAV